MDSNTQNPVGTENTDLGPTRNPQTPGGQNLGVGSGNLQNPTNLVTNSDTLSITSVGNSDNTQPATIATSSQTTVTTPPTSNNPPYGLFALSAIAIAAVFLITWLMSRPKED